MSDNFFTEQKEQSLVKATIVEKYFVAWAKIMTSVVRDLPPDKQKIAYVDLFAGPGCYKDGSKSTPIKILEKAIADPNFAKMLLTLFLVPNKFVFIEKERTATIKGRSN